MQSTTPRCSATSSPAPGAARIATSAIPVQAKIAYQLATTLETGSIDDPFDANLWAATAFSEAAVVLARH